MQGKKRIGWSSFIISTGIPIVALPVLLLAKLVGFPCEISYATAVLIMWAVSQYVWYRIALWGSDVSSVTDVSSINYSNLLSLAWPLAIVAAAQQTINWLPMILVSKYADLTEVGVFSAAQRIATLLGFIL
ncbi:MAG: hypothetical protein CUN54_10010, partial [Phototrophicales bacterium]